MEEELVEIFSIFACLALFLQMIVGILILKKHNGFTECYFKKIPVMPRCLISLPVLGLGLVFSVADIHISYLIGLLKFSITLLGLTKIGPILKDKKIIMEFCVAIPILLFLVSTLLPEYFLVEIMKLSYIMIDLILGYDIYIFIKNAKKQGVKLEECKLIFFLQGSFHVLISVFLFNKEYLLINLFNLIGLVECLILYLLDIFWIVSRKKMGADLLLEETGMKINEKAFHSASQEKFNEQPTNNLPPPEDELIIEKATRSSRRNEVVTDEECNKALINEEIKVEHDPESKSHIKRNVTIKRLIKSDIATVAKKFIKKKEEKVVWENTHFILVLDCSGSMIGRNWMNLRKAYKMFLLTLTNMPGNIVSIFSFDDVPHILCKEYTPVEAMKIADELKFGGGGTNYTKAIETCISLIKKVSPKFNNYMNHILLFSNGVGDDPWEEIAQLKDMKKQGTPLALFTVACETEDDDDLIRMAVALCGDHYNTTSSVALKQIFSKILAMTQS